MQLFTDLGIYCFRTAEDTLGRLRGALTNEEIKKYVEHCLKPGKSSGPGKCPNELLKTMTEEDFVTVQELVDEILTLTARTDHTKNGPKRATMNGTISQLHKGGSTNKNSDQRPVVLLNSVYQLLNYIINERLKRIVEPANLLEPWQGGGRQGRCVNINMQQLHLITHEANGQPASPGFCTCARLPACTRAFIVVSYINFFFGDIACPACARIYGCGQDIRSS